MLLLLLQLQLLLALRAGFVVVVELIRLLLFFFWCFLHLHHYFSVHVAAEVDAEAGAEVALYRCSNTRPIAPSVFLGATPFSRCRSCSRRSHLTQLCARYYSQDGVFHLGLGSWGAIQAISQTHTYRLG